MCHLGNFEGKKKFEGKKYFNGIKIYDRNILSFIFDSFNEVCVNNTVIRDIVKGEYDHFIK